MCYSIYTIPDHPVNERQREAAAKKVDVAGLLGDQQLAMLAGEACRLTNTRMAAVTILQDDLAYLIATSGFPAGIYRRSTSLCGHAILTPHRVYVVPDTLADERFAGNPYVIAEGGIRFYAAAQLIAGDDLAIGTLCVFDDRPRDIFSTGQRSLLIQLADEVTSRLAVELRP